MGIRRPRCAVIVAATALGCICAGSGCGPSFKELRLAGQNAAAEQKWGVARGLFVDAYRLIPEDEENLHDLGVCSTMLARERFAERNEPAGMREIDRAIEYYSRSINAHPGYRPAIVGKNRALELKGQFEEALRSAYWAATYVGPSAEQQAFLASEYEERGDLDAALLRLRQGIAMEPNNPAAYEALGDFYYRTGKMEEASAAYRQAFNLNPAQMHIADKLRRMGEGEPPPPIRDTQ